MYRDKNFKPNIDSTKRPTHCTIRNSFFANCTNISSYLANCTIEYCYLANCMIQNFCVWLSVGTFTWQVFSKINRLMWKLLWDSSKCGKNLWHIGATIGYSFRNLVYSSPHQKLCNIKKDMKKTNMKKDMKKLTWRKTWKKLTWTKTWKELTWRKTWKD